MQLVYVWIEKYGCIKNQEHNFLPEYQIHYENGIITFARDNDSCRFNWGTNITSVTTIIGENGKGKTTLMKFLFKAIEAMQIENKTLSYLGNAIILFKNETEFFIYSTIKTSYKILEEDFKVVVMDEIKSGIIPIFYTNVLDLPQYMELKSTGDLCNNYSLSARVIRAWKSIREQEHIQNIDAIMEFYHIEMKSQIKAVESIKNIFSLFKLNIKLKEIWQYIDSDWIKTWEEGVQTDLKKLFGSIEKKRIRNLSKGDGKYDLMKGVIFSLIQSNRTYLKKTKDWQGFINQLQHDVDLDKEPIEIIRNVSACCLPIKEKMDSYKNVISFIQNSCDFINYGLWQYDLHDKKAIEELIKFYSNYEECIFKINGFLDFEWGLSSGEFALFSIFAILNDAISELKNNDKTKSVLLLIDEADLYLHPKWQQNFLNLLLIYLEKQFPNISFQIFITTHSPIFLSDIPNFNVIYLTESGNGKRKNNKTFAANIYELYSDSFFLNNGKNGAFMPYIIGNFAIKKLIEIQEKLKRLKKCEYSIKSEQEIMQIKSILDCIGEPLIYKFMYEDWQNTYCELMCKKYKRSDKKTYDLISLVENLNHTEKIELAELLITLLKGNE